jgi:hypothetical protein
MTFNDRQNDQVDAQVASLRMYDVSQPQADRLRSRCHAMLQTQPGRNAPVVIVNGTLFQRVIGPVLGGAWCLAYLAEIIRRAAAIYGF